MEVLHVIIIIIICDIEDKQMQSVFIAASFFARAGLFAHTRAVSMNQFTDLRYNLTIMVPQITQTLFKKLALSLDWGPNLSV